MSHANFFVMFYVQMVLYIEACESGSMFVGDLLPKDINGEWVSKLRSLLSCSLDVEHV